MIARSLATDAAHASWRVALLAVLPLAGFLLPSMAEAQQPAQTIIILRGAGSQPAGGLTAECAAACVKSQTAAPDDTWKVTCIFNL